VAEDLPDEHSLITEVAFRATPPPKSDSCFSEDEKAACAD
jgi:hypothetical protein